MGSRRQWPIWTFRRTPRLIQVNACKQSVETHSRGALCNLLERDRMFTERLSGDVKRLGLCVIEVGSAMTEDDLAG